MRQARKDAFDCRQELHSIERNISKSQTEYAEKKKRIEEMQSDLAEEAAACNEAEMTILKGYNKRKEMMNVKLQRFEEVLEQGKKEEEKIEAVREALRELIDGNKNGEPEPKRLKRE